MAYLMEGQGYRITIFFKQNHKRQKHRIVSTSKLRFQFISFSFYNPMLGVGVCHFQNVVWTQNLIKISFPSVYLPHTERGRKVPYTKESEMRESIFASFQFLGNHYRILIQLNLFTKQCQNYYVTLKTTKKNLSLAELN